LEEYGIKVNDAVTKNTAVLLVQNMDEGTSKVDKAKKYKIPIMLATEFLMH